VGNPIVVKVEEEEGGDGDVSLLPCREYEEGEGSRE